ncbi:MAG: beta-glucosidase, partial [Bacteroidales bacterium]|nr:beta-glucosidase [Bacteroidales bacterium]
MHKTISFLSAVVAGFVLCCSCSCPSTGGKDDKDENTDNEVREQLCDEEFLDLMEQTHLKYMWDGALPVSGLAPERIHENGVYPQNDADVIAVGGSGFGIAGLVAGMERGFISREEGVARLRKIVDFLLKADTFHGAFPHWLEDRTGKVRPFGKEDNGGDIVETSFLIEGLLCARQYLSKSSVAEKELAADIDRIWHNVEWDWYQKGTTDKLYWHWSPEYGWKINFAIEGYNECLITYILAASSPTHPINSEAYHKCWARNGGIVSDKTAYDLPLVLKYNGAEEYSGPLFWSHYS